MRERQRSARDWGPQLSHHLHQAMQSRDNIQDINLSNPSSNPLLFHPPLAVLTPATIPSPPPPTQHHSPTTTASQTDHTAAADLLKGFQWTSHWWPVAVSATTDTTKPHAVQLLGRQLVLWRDSTSEPQWHCMEDACPHRYSTRAAKGDVCVIHNCDHTQTVTGPYSRSHTTHNTSSHPKTPTNNTPRTIHTTCQQASPPQSRPHRV